MLIIIPYLLLELYFSLAVGSRIGFMGSVLWILVSFIIGMGLLQNAHLTIMKGFESLTLGKMDGKSFHDSSTAYFLGALFLIIPGVFSDFLGVLLLLYSLYLQFGGTIPFIKNKTNIKNSTRQGDENVIDVEIIECDTTRDTKP